MNALTRLIGGPRVNVEPAPRKFTLDEAYKLACSAGRPEIGGFRGPQSAELKLHEDIAGSHYIVLRCHKHESAAENLMDCVATAQRIREALVGAP